MKKLIELVLIILISNFIFGQSNHELEIPASDSDSLIDETFEIEFNSKDNTFKIKNYYFNKITNYYYLNIYSFNANDLDTAMIIRAKNENGLNCTMKIFSCIDSKITLREVKEDPGKNEMKFMSDIQFGDWNYNLNEKKLNKVVKFINKKIKKQNLCQNKRGLDYYSENFGHWDNIKNFIVYHTFSEEMPVLNGSNSIESRANELQKLADKFVIENKITDTLIFELIFSVSKNSQISNVLLFGIENRELEDGLKTYFEKMQGWKAGKWSNEYSNFKIQSLIGINVKDKKDFLKKKLKESEKFITSSDYLKWYKENHKELFNYQDNNSKDKDKIDLSGWDLKPDESEIAMICEEMPRFPGCEDKSNRTLKENCSKEKLMEYISSNLQYPQKAIDNKIEGKVTLRFIVEINGTIKNVEILRDIGGGCGEEAKRIIESMNKMPVKWIPGKQGGRKVKGFYTLPVVFELKN